VIFVPDIEEVIKALDCLAEGTYCSCCYYGNYHECTKKIAKDAAELLRDYKLEQDSAWEDREE